MKTELSPNAQTVALDLFIGYVVLVWAFATAFVFLATWLFRYLSVESPIGFWALLGCLLIFTFPIYYRLATAYIPSRPVARIALVGLLSVITYFIAISAAFLIGTLFVGA